MFCSVRAAGAAVVSGSISGLGSSLLVRWVATMRSTAFRSALASTRRRGVKHLVGREHLQNPDVNRSHEPVGIPLNRPPGTFSPTGGEGRDEGVRFMERQRTFGSLLLDSV